MRLREVRYGFAASAEGDRSEWHANIDGAGLEELSQLYARLRLIERRIAEKLDNVKVQEHEI